MHETSQLLSNRNKSFLSSIQKITWDILHYKASIQPGNRNWTQKVSYFTELFILNLILLNVVLTVWASLQVNDDNTNRIHIYIQLFE